MAPLPIPPQLKHITQFIRRAEELDSDHSRPESRVVAYHCRQYAVSKAIQTPSLQDDSKTCLSKLLDSLESEKQAMKLFSTTECQYVCRRFATEIFEKVSKEERSGTVTKSTAKGLYAAATFYESLSQFYENEEESEEKAEEEKKRLWCKWKATEILKALREGREYVSNTAEDTEEEKQGELEEGTSENHGLESMSVPPYAPNTEIVRDEVPSAPPLPIPVAVPYVPPTARPPPTQSNGGIFSASSRNRNNTTQNQIDDALELTRFAEAALKVKDVNLAADRLKKALSCLGC